MRRRRNPQSGCCMEGDERNFMLSHALSGLLEEELRVTHKMFDGWGCTHEVSPRATQIKRNVRVRGPTLGAVVFVVRGDVLLYGGGHQGHTSCSDRALGAVFAAKVIRVSDPSSGRDASASGSAAPIPAPTFQAGNEERTRRVATAPCPWGTTAPWQCCEPPLPGSWRSARHFFRRTWRLSSMRASTSRHSARSCLPDLCMGNHLRTPNLRVPLPRAV